MMTKQDVVVFWFRRDLRLDDNIGLYHALKSEHPVLPIFIFDSEILDGLPRDDARVSFIYEKVQGIREKLQKKWGSSLAVYHGEPLAVFEKLLQDFSIVKVMTNHDYEPYAIARDKKIASLLNKNGISFETFKDQVIFEKNEVVKSDGSPYLVYTPYMKKWKELFAKNDMTPVNSTALLKNCIQNTNLPNLTLSEIGFKKSEIKVPDFQIDTSLLQSYNKTRNLPAIEGTSQLSTHLRFGTVGIRKIVEHANAAQDKTFLNELIWREFFMQILYHFPHTTTKAFKKQYDTIKWRNNEKEFEAWKTGTTGYPMVDAGMRQLNQTGWMHNRVRMVVGSFLCKHLLIDWRWGEAYFAEKLLDYEMSSNVGNWQWVAGCGVDAAPYFRIFNPTTQVEKFDPQQEYINRWIPEYGTADYPKPIVDHKEARDRALEVYKKAVS